MSSNNLTQDNIDTKAYLTICNGLVSGSQSSTISNGSTSRILCEVSGDHNSSNLSHLSNSPCQLASTSSAVMDRTRNRHMSSSKKSLKHRLSKCYLKPPEIIKILLDRLDNLNLQKKENEEKVSFIEERFKKSLKQICRNVRRKSRYHDLLELSNKLHQAIKDNEEEISEISNSIEKDNHVEVIPVQQTTLYGRTTVPRQFYHFEQFMQGSNNEHTKGRHVDTYCRKSTDDNDD
jgi:hypothetical protein